MKRVIIIGAGPTGLGAARRLRQLGHENFMVYERNSYAGGLCASFIDDSGFTWEIGGHVIFSHYRYFDDFLTEFAGEGLLDHRREAWIRTKGRWVPYPFQNNLRYLPQKVVSQCLRGLEKRKERGGKPANFEEWIIDNLGEGIARHFMVPYNFKTWAHPPALLSADWMAERVSRPAMEEIVANMKSAAPATSWGPNAMFKYPVRGGVGEIFRNAAKSLKGKVKFNSRVVMIDPELKKIHFSGGVRDDYDVLINTAPLDRFMGLLKGCRGDMLNAARDLKHNGVFVAGVGIRKPCPDSKCWIYFPDDNCPFFRTTYLSNYSPNNTPDGKKHYSLLCETAYSRYKKESKSGIAAKTVQGLVNSGLLRDSDRKFIMSQFLFDADYAYPVPTLKRNSALRTIQPGLERMDIYSRGRFGAWKYEIGNTDHSVMQGKEIADRILKKGKETVWSL